ncbi:MAG: peptidylprolyl isomerase [Dehalococcoidia bacterium]
MSRGAKGRQPTSRRKSQSGQMSSLSTKKKLLIGIGAVAVIVLIVIVATIPSKPKTYSAPPPMMIDTSKQYTATIETENGNLVLELFASDAPITVNNFVFLARERFYDGLTFHRVVREPSPFVAQGGCPNGDGTGGPGYRFDDEITEHTHIAGALSMANSGPNTNGSQFFITYTPQHHLDGKHSVFGQLIEGMDVLESLENGDVMIRVTIHEG